MGELIDREAVREFIKSYRHSTDFAFHMENHLDEIPAASPWHRVEEPPKSFEMVIAYVDPWHIFAAYHNGHGTWKENDGFNVIGVRYWMPIEPPEEENE